MSVKITYRDEDGFVQTYTVPKSLEVTATRYVSGWGYQIVSVEEV